MRKYSGSLKKHEQSIPKIYPVDNGLIEMICGDDKGKKMENMVFLSLLGSGLDTTRHIFYYKVNNHEVDFVIHQKKKVTALIQVCYDVSHYQTLNREIRSLIKSRNELNCSNLLIVTYDHEDTIKNDGRKIKLIPLHKWLYSTNSFLW